jgi:hypothetical protein
MYTQKEIRLIANKVESVVNAPIRCYFRDNDWYLEINNLKCRLIYDVSLQTLYVTNSNRGFNFRFNQSKMSDLPKWGFTPLELLELELKITEVFMHGNE